ncbi:hypothetical protein [Nafulsella turpanensis]|uniref:hypothetical protein n=1 Tax=Nafulsella turpanensis TaxID=1265690 RepID=UPI000346213F|nr:hypothetical protein [Nafulsella turpanensis]
MAQFIAFEESVEVSSQSISSVIKALPVNQELKGAIMKTLRIEKPEAGQWFSQQAWLNIYKELSESMGDEVLFSIGRSIPEHIGFPPPGTGTLQKALESIDQAHRLNHRGGEIGSYRLVEFNEQDKRAVMVCQTPYPSEVDRGIIHTILKKFRPASSSSYSVQLNTARASRTNGSHSCTFNISW